MKYSFLIFAIWLPFLSVHAQNQVFDPLLDETCKTIINDKEELWNSCYMWYPGQLSAHLQRIQKEKSEARCIHVNYPGNFTKDVNRAYFRKEIKLSEETDISWHAKGKTDFYIDGRKQSSKTGKYKIKRGKHLLLFDIQTIKGLPAIIIQGKDIENIQGWQVSLDGQIWNLPETNAKYNSPNKLPDKEQELIVSIPAKECLLLRNVSNKDGILELGENACLLVDFHHLEVGNVVIQASGSGILSFNVGESPEEALNENTQNFEQKAIPRYKLQHRVQEIKLPEYALRYLKISCDKPCIITSIRHDAKIWPVEFQMQFTSDNDGLNNLWNASVATLHTSMHNFYLDGIKRDYLPWSMDAIISALGGDYVFGDRQVARNGISIALMPSNPKISDWGIIDYPLHALIGLKQDYMRYGDLSSSLMFKERIIQQLALYESVQDVNGFLTATPPTSGFIPGWSRKMGPDDFGTATYAQMMLYLNFKIGAYFAHLWKENMLAHHYEQKAKLLGNNIVRHFWDNTQKAFINGYHANGEKDTRISHHAQYWGILSELYPTQYYDYLFDKVIPSIPFYKENISYEKGYECLAYIKAGRINDMFTLLNEVWGNWLQQGYTRFPENFSPEAPLKQQLTFYERPFGLSLCHGANGVPPIIGILHGIYGFSQSDKNISNYILRPNLINMNWTKGRIPIKEGYINLYLAKEGKCTVEIPKGCIIHLYTGQKTKPLILGKAGKYTFTLHSESKTIE